MLKPTLQKLLAERQKTKAKQNRPANITAVSYVLKKVANPIRLAIIYLLEKQGELSVNNMVGLLECEQSLLSHHLQELRDIGLLKAERKGQQVFYSVTDKNFSALLRNIEEFDFSIEKK